MATGTVTVFNEFTESIGDGRIDLDTDTFKLALIDNVVTPTVDAATPAWDVSSDENYDGNEVNNPDFGGYVTGGVTLTSVIWDRTAAVTKFDAADVVMTQNASGFTNAYWGIIYSETATNNDAIAFIELGGPVSQVAGPVTIAFNDGGILTSTRT